MTIKRNLPGATGPDSWTWEGLQSPNHLLGYAANARGVPRIQPE
jgi:hypothetical protein